MKDNRPSARFIPAMSITVITAMDNMAVMGAHVSQERVREQC
jgi:hypothetical protein